jgi:hypothetical protein
MPTESTADDGRTLTTGLKQDLTCGVQQAVVVAAAAETIDGIKRHEAVCQDQVRQRFSGRGTS